MTFTKFPNNLCTFCYKRVSRTEDEGNQQNIELCSRFYKHLSSFVNNSSSFTLPCKIVCCIDCEFLIGEFCEVHQQIKCLELQLQWKLETLAKVMKLADKVPSRVKGLKQSFVELDNTSETSNEEETESLAKDHNGQSAIQLYINLRQEILSKCHRSRNISQLQPRVVLKRLNLADKQINNTEMNQFVDYTTPKGRIGFDFVIGWLMSFGALIFLQSLYSNHHYKSTADDNQSLLVYDDNDRSTSSESLEEEEHHKEIPATFSYQSNDNIEDNDIEEHSISEGQTSFFINPTEDPANDGSSTSSKENPAETLDLKHEPISEAGTENLFENLNNAIRKPSSFPCQFCSVICTSESLLEKHEALRHPLFKTNFIKTNYPFLCGPCKRFYKNYASLRRHKFSSLHRSLDKERTIKHVQILPNIKSEQTFGLNQQFKDTQAVPKKKINSKRYNLRSAINKSYKSKNDHNRDLKLDSDKDYLQDITSSDTSSFETSDLEDNDDCLSSNKYSNDKFRCLLDDCKLKQTVYFKKFHFNQHKKLHIRGKYQCHFCEKIERTIIDLSLHETEMHSVIPSTSTSKIKSDSIYYCARCPFETQNEGTYFKHFAIHVGVNVVQKKRHNIRCEQCPASFKTNIGLFCHKKKIHHNQEPPQPKLKTHKCEKCEKTFEKPIHLEKHLDTEHPDSNISSDFKCAKCDRYFVSKNSLKVHIKQIHSGKRSGKHNDNVILPYICLLDRCKRRFKDYTSLKFHQNLHKRGKYPCKFCDTVMNSILTLSVHESSKHPFKNENDHREGLHYCSRCCYKNKSAWRYQTHFARIHLKTIKKSEFIFNENPLGKYKCNFCDIECPSASKLGYHEADHVNQRTQSDDRAKLKIQCPRCPTSHKKLGFIKHFLKVHFDGCTKEKQTVCPICQVKGTLPKEHFNTFHNTKNLEDPSKIYKCEGEDDACKAYFVKDFQLLIHKRKMHRQIKEWTCKICKRLYKNEKSLQGHTNIKHKDVLENPELPFGCNIDSCKRRFNTEDELEYHKKFVRHKVSVQIGMRCEKCDKMFSNKTTLKKHITLKHEEQLFICQECGKAFGTKGNLLTHSEYHKGPDAWKFQCSTCGKKCVSKFTLTAHLRTHTGEKPYVCQYCGEKYGHLHNWKNHMLKKHKNQDDLPEIRKTASKNRLSRKGTKKGDCVIAEVKQ